MADDNSVEIQGGVRSTTLSTSMLGPGINANPEEEDESEVAFLNERLAETIDLSEIDGPSNTFEVQGGNEFWDPDYWVTAEQLDGLRIPRNTTCAIPKPAD